ncbi:MAG: LolA family protein, partial [Candidatus Adiutrix sp.]
MQIKFIIGVWAVLLFFPVGIALASPTKDHIIMSLAANYENLSSLRAEYSRIAKTPASEQLFQSSSAQTAVGTLSWLKPSNLLLAQKTPELETLVTDGLSVFWHIPAEKIAYQYINVDVAAQLKPFLTFLAGLETLEQSFLIETAPAESNRQGQYGLTLIPKGADPTGFDQITVWCDSDFNLTGFKLASPTGETTDFTFTAV